MKPYQQQLTSHPIHGVIAQLRQLLATPGLQGEDANVRMQLDKVAALIGYAEQCVRLLVPELTNFDILTSAQQHIQNVINEVNAYGGDKNLAHLINAASHANQAIIHFNQLAVPPSEVVSGTLASILASHRTASDQFIAVLSKQRDQLQAELVSTKERLTQQDQAIAQAKEVIEAQKNALGTELVALKTQFSELKSGWQDSSKQLFDGFSANYAEVVRSGESSRDKFLQESEGRAGQVLDRLASLQAEAEKTTGAIGVTGLVGSYQTSADQEQDSANLFRWIALGIMGTAALVLAATLVEMAFYGLDWKPALVRLIGALILSFPGGYCAAESGRHRKAATRARRFEMELSSLSAYLATMPVEQVNQLKLQLSSRFFGREEPDEKLGAVMPLDKFIDLATEMAKRK